MRASDESGDLFAEAFGVGWSSHRLVNHGVSLMTAEIRLRAGHAHGRSRAAETPRAGHPLPDALFDVSPFARRLISRNTCRPSGILRRAITRNRSGPGYASTRAFVVRSAAGAGRFKTRSRHVHAIVGIVFARRSADSGRDEMRTHDRHSNAHASQRDALNITRPSHRPA